MQAAPETKQILYDAWMLRNRELKISMYREKLQAIHLMALAK